MPTNVVRKIVLYPGNRRSIEKALAQGRGIERELRNFGNQEVIDRTVSQIRTRVLAPMLRLLAVYPARQLGMRIRWKSERQRRKVMMLLVKQAKEEGRYPDNIAYRRTRGLGKAWEADIKYDKKRGVITVKVENTAARQDERTGRMVKIQPFVTGNIGIGKSESSMQRYRRPMQPFHIDRGWQLSAPIIRRYMVEKAPAEAQKRYEERLARIVKKEYPN